MKSSKGTQNPIQKLKERVYKFTFTENPVKNKKSSFDMKKFIVQSKEVKKTFKNEDLFRLRSNLSAE